MSFPLQENPYNGILGPGGLIFSALLKGTHSIGLITQFPPVNSSFGGQSLNAITSH